MKKITVFEALDGSRWNDEESCFKRDMMFIRAASITASLGDRPTLKDNEYKLHSYDNIEIAKAGLNNLAKHYLVLLILG